MVHKALNMIIFAVSTMEIGLLASLLLIEDYTLKIMIGSIAIILNFASWITSIIGYIAAKNA